MTAQEFNAATINRDLQKTLIQLRDQLPDIGPGVDPTAQDLQVAAFIYANLTPAQRRIFVNEAKAAATARIQQLNTEFTAL